MKKTCEGCKETERTTPLIIANRPGLNALQYRAGTHASFFETMQARLSNHVMDNPDGLHENSDLRPLQALSTRSADDPAIAMLDAWATVADVLTFYQERIANEGYLRTATERRSIMELGRLVGYNLRPGVAASVFLAFTVEDVGHEVEIPAGTRAQSLPGPGELPQSFETSEKLIARPEWNILKPRLTKKQNFIHDKMLEDSSNPLTVSFKDANINLKKNDLLLFEFSSGKQLIYKVADVVPKPPLDQTEVTLIFWGPDSIATTSPAHRSNSSPSPDAIESIVERALSSEMVAHGVTFKRVEKLLQTLLIHLASDISPDEKLNVYDEILSALKNELEKARGANIKAWLDEIIAGLEAIAERPVRSYEKGSDKHIITEQEIESYHRLSRTIAAIKTLPAQHPASAQQLPLTTMQAFAVSADASLQTIVAMDQRLARLYPILAEKNFSPTKEEHEALVRISVFRVKAAPFGHNAPLQYTKDHPQGQEWLLSENTKNEVQTNLLTLDTSYEQILQGSLVAIENSLFKQRTIILINSVQTISRTDYGIPATTTTQLTLRDRWLPDFGEDILPLRSITVYAQPEVLAQAEDLPEVLVTERAELGFNQDEPARSMRIELDALYPGLQSGRWLIVEGERAELPGIIDRELVMLAGIEQTPSQDPGDNATRTTLILSDGLAFNYKTDTVKIYANVAKATHGETRQEVLGSGDGTKTLQSFELRQAPLTFLAAPTATGTASTLRVRVNDILWEEKDSLAELSRTDRNFITRTNDENKTTVVFGNGEQGSRLPTGIENVTAVYRSGIGRPGNVKSEQISLLATKPLGVKSVINPLAASGGADKERPDQARKNTPLAVMALDRLVSTQDYADFARTFAGIGKASAVRLSDGQRQLVHVTIAGNEDIRIDRNSDLYQSLYQAFHQFGDPHQSVQIDVRELLLLVISARVRLQPAYLWDKVKPQIQQALLNAFGFDRRELGQDVLASEVISIIQSVPGVVYVDLDTFDAVNEYLILKSLINLKAVAESLTLKPRVAVNMAGPVYHIVASSDETLGYIALLHGMTAEQLKLLNPELSSKEEFEPLKSGTPLLIRRLGPAQLAILSPDVKNSLLLNEITV